MDIYFPARRLTVEYTIHGPLMDKLVSTNVNPHIVKWVHSYLSNRTQHVVVNGCDSAVLPVISGVPQGSVLGPYLFLVYINEIIDAISEHPTLYLRVFS